jgi:hypothetical protein
VLIRRFRQTHRQARLGTHAGRRGFARRRFALWFCRS